MTDAAETLVVTLTRPITHNGRPYKTPAPRSAAADLSQRWTPEFGQLAKVGSRPRRRSLACHGRDGVIRLS